MSALIRMTSPTRRASPEWVESPRSTFRGASEQGADSLGAGSIATSSAVTMQRATVWVPRVVSALAFVMFVFAAPPGTYWLDSGELGAAAVGWGSPHPTGFPLLMVVGKLLALIPIGELAFRVNLVSASCGGVCVLLVAQLVQATARGDGAAVLGGAAAGSTLAVSLVFLRQATVTEVYLPMAVLLAAALLLLDRVARGGEAAEGLGLAILLGLGLGTHTSIGLVVLPALAVWLMRLRRGARWPLLAPLLVVLVAGALYVYLPVRRVERIDWGHPQRISGFLEHVTAARIRRAYGEEMRSTSWPVIRQNLGELFEQLGDSLGPLALLAALAGLAWLVRHKRSRWLGASVAVVLIGDFVYGAWINPMGLVDLQNGVPFAVAASIAAGVGLAWLVRTLGAVGPFVGAVAVVLLVVPPAAGSLPAIWSARSGDLPRAVAEAALAETPPRGLLLVESDSLAATTLLLTVTEQARPDVAVLVRQHLWDATRTNAVLALAGAETPAVPRDDALIEVLGLGRKIAWELGEQSPPAGWRLQIGAPVSLLAPIHTKAQPAAFGASAARWAALFAHPSRRDRAAAMVLASALTTLGRVAVTANALDAAETMFETALALRPRHVTALVNRSVVAARRGRLAEAAALSEQALALDPLRLSALINLGRYAIGLGQLPRARAALQRALMIDSRRADAWALLAVVDFNSGVSARGLTHLARALALDSRNRDAAEVWRQLAAKRRRR